MVEMYIYRNIAINMGAIKNIEYQKEQLILAQWTKALSHPARIAIIEFLSKQNSCVCGDIVLQLDLSQSTVSQHLKALKEIGFIKGEIEGVTTCYCLDTKVWAQFKESMSLFINRIQENPSSCCSND